MDEDISKIGFEPDYTMSTYEVYRSAALSLIQYTKRLEVLTMVKSHELEGVPSWVPDASIVL